MELQELLRKHQAKTTAKRLQLERNLAQHKHDLRTKTQELENLSQRYAQSQKIEREREKEGFHYHHFVFRQYKIYKKNYITNQSINHTHPTKSVIIMQLSHHYLTN